MDPAALTTALKEESLRLGFDLVGATTADLPPSFEHFRPWLADGFAGEMRYLAERLDAYGDPNQILSGVRSILMLGVNYRTVEPAAAGPGYAKVSRYAWGADYHEVVRRRLHKLADFHRRLTPAARVPRRGRYGAAAGTRIGSTGRPGLDRQEHPTHRLAVRQLAVLGRALDDGGSLAFGTDEDRDVWFLSRVPRCLPDGRIGRSVSARRSQVRQLLDDRIAWRNPGGASRRVR